MSSRLRERRAQTAKNKKRRPVRNNRVATTIAENKKLLPSAEQQDSNTLGPGGDLEDDTKAVQKGNVKEEENVDINVERGSDQDLDSNGNYQSENVALRGEAHLENGAVPSPEEDDSRMNETVTMQANGIAPEIMTSSDKPEKDPESSSHASADDVSDDWVTLNVGGTLFQTYGDTFQRAQEGPLSNLSSTSPFYHKPSNQLRFDRNPFIFQYVLDFLRTGQLHMPPQACGAQFKDELQFWGIPCDAISSCCYAKFQEHEEEAETLAHVQKAFDDGAKSRHYDEGCFGNCVSDTWYFLEYPGYSCASKIWAFMYILMVLMSLVTMVLDTHQDFRVNKTEVPPMKEGQNSSKWVMLQQTDPHPVVWGIEFVTTLLFTIEIVIRFIVCPDKKVFLMSVLHWADFASSVAQWVLLGLTEFTVDYLQDRTLRGLFWFCLLFRTLRVSRIFRLARHYRGLQILLLALRASIWELLLLVVFVVLGTLVFATWMYYAEFGEPDNIPNIPVGFWWAIVTMTTVGYGDVHPTSSWGYAVGSFCTVVGMLATGLPIPIIAHNFSLYYSYSKLKTRMERQPQFNISFKNVTQPFNNLLALVSPLKKQEHVEVDINPELQKEYDEKETLVEKIEIIPTPFCGTGKDDADTHVTTENCDGRVSTVSDPKLPNTEETSGSGEKDLEHSNADIGNDNNERVHETDDALINEELKRAEKQSENEIPAPVGAPAQTEQPKCEAQDQPRLNSEVQNMPENAARNETPISTGSEDQTQPESAVGDGQIQQEATNSDSTPGPVGPTESELGNPERPSSEGMPAVEGEDHKEPEVLRMRPLPRLLTAIPGRRQIPVQPADTVPPMYNSEDNDSIL